MISLEGLDKAEVLAALYNASRPQGMGFVKYTPEPMTAEEARELLSQRTHFDYLKGRVMKVDLSQDTLNPWGYDRDNGQGAALEAISAIGDSERLSVIHTSNTEASIENVKEAVDEQTTAKTEGDVMYVTLGLAQHKDAIEEGIKRFNERA